MPSSAGVALKQYYIIGLCSLMSFNADKKNIERLIGHWLIMSIFVFVFEKNEVGYLDQIA